MFTIEIEYSTGSSFHSESGCRSYLDGKWSLETAKENLNRIKEHYRAYSDLNSYVSTMMGKRGEKLLESIKSKPWYVEKPDRIQYNCPEYWNYTIKLLEDDGSEKCHDTGDWIGYFETLDCAEIVPVKDGSMSFRP